MVKAVSANEIDLAWTWPGHPDFNYVIKESTGGTSTQLPGTVSGTTDAVTNLVGGTTYSFQVEAVDQDGRAASPWSAPASATTILEAPTFTAHAISSTSIVLSWTAVSGATDGYLIDGRPLLFGGPLVQLAAPAAGTVSYKFDNLRPATSYIFEMAARNATEQSSWSDLEGADTYTQTPTIWAKAASSNEIDLRWTEATGAEIYAIDEYVVDAFGVATEIGTVHDVKGTSDQLTGFLPNTTYGFRIWDVGYDGVPSSLSNLATALTFPAPPTVTATTVSTGEIDLSWPAVPGATKGYVVDELIGGKPMQIATFPGGSTSYKDPVTGLAPGTPYSFQVGASNASGTSLSPVVNGTTLPVAPTLTTATPASANEVDLAWTAPFGATGYQPQYSSNNGLSWTNAPAASGTSTQIDNLNPVTNYLFRVDASDAGGPSAWSNTLSALTFPAAPTVTATAVSTREIDLSWPAVPGATNGYVVDELIGGQPMQIGTLAGGGSSYNCPVTGLAPGANYSFRVGASNASGTSFSGDVSAATLPGTPATITVKASAASMTAGTSIGVTITAQDVSGFPSNNYTVTLSTSTGQSWPVHISDGTGTIAITLTKAGAVTLKASYGSASGQTNISVSPAAATFSIGGFPTSMTVGQAASLTFTVEDRYGNRYGNTLVNIGNSTNLSVSATAVRTNGSGQATVIVTALHSGVVNGAGAHITLAAAGANAGVGTTIYPSQVSIVATVTAVFEIEDGSGDMFDLSQTFQATAANLQDLETEVSDASGNWEHDVEEYYFDNYDEDITLFHSDVTGGTPTADD